MEENIVDNIFDYLGIFLPDSNKTIQKINTLVTYNLNPIIPKKIKSNRKRGNDRPGIGGQVFDLPDINWQDQIVDYIDPPRPAAVVAENRPIGRFEAVPDDMGRIYNYYSTADTKSTATPAKKELTQEEYNSLKSQYESYYIRFKANDFSRLSVSYMVMEDLKQRLNNSVVKPIEEVKIQTKVALLNNFIDRYNNPGIVRGYIIKGKLYTNPTKLSEYDKMDVVKGRASVVVELFYVLDGKVRTKIKTLTSNTILSNSNISTSQWLEILPAILKLKIESAKNSIEVFGKESKQELVGNYIDEWAVQRGVSKKIGNTYYIKLNHLNTTYKFVLPDVKIINKELTGYNLPKQANSLNIGDFVEIKPQFRALYKPTQLTGHISNIKPYNASKRIPGTNRRRKDHMTIVSLDRGMKPFKVYAEHICKLERNVIKEKEDRPLSF